jgi:hypothetical protein
MIHTLTPILIVTLGEKNPRLQAKTLVCFLATRIPNCRRIKPGGEMGCLAEFIRRGNFCPQSYRLQAVVV